MNHERSRSLETETPLDGSRFEGIVFAPSCVSPFRDLTAAKKIFSLVVRESTNRQEFLPVCKADPLNHVCKRTVLIEDVRRAQSCGDHPRAAALGKNILTVGATRLRQDHICANAVLDAMGSIAQTDWHVSIEDTTELQYSVPNHVDLLAVGKVSMLDCLRACMRLKPTRIVVGEVRGRGPATRC